MAIAKLQESAPEAVVKYTASVKWTREEDGEYYLASSDDIDGLTLGADSLDEMKQYMREVIPHLLELNHGIEAEKVAGIDVRILGKADPYGETQFEISHPA